MCLPSLNKVDYDYNYYQGAVLQCNGLPNLEARSLSAEISEKVQPPRNMTSLHFDPGDSFVLESVKNKNKFLFRVLGKKHQTSAKSENRIFARAVPSRGSKSAYARITKACIPDNLQIRP